MSMKMGPCTMVTCSGRFPPRLAGRLRNIGTLPCTSRVGSRRVIGLSPSLLVVDSHCGPLCSRLSRAVPAIIIRINNS